MHEEQFLGRLPLAAAQFGGPARHVDEVWGGDALVDHLGASGSAGSCKISIGGVAREGGLDSRGSSPVAGCEAVGAA